MRTNIGLIMSRQPLVRAVAGTEVTLKWSTYTGGSQDPLTGAVTGATETVESEVVKALVHQTVPKSVLRTYQEIQAGDLLVDFDAGLDLEREGLRFEVLGKTWAQAQVGEAAVAAFQAVHGENEIYQTVLLRMV